MPDDADDLTRPERLPQQVARRIRALIEAGHYRPGDQLDSEPSLARRYGVARQTARQALAILRAEGLVEAEQGRGTFVRTPPIRVAFSRYAHRSRAPREGPFEATCRKAGVPGYMEMVLVERRTADDVVAGGLDVPVGTEVICRRRYGHAGDPDQIIQIQEGYLPAELVNGTPLAGAERIPEGIYAALDAIGHGPHRITEEVSARLPTFTESAIFRIQPGMPVIDIKRRTYDATKRIVEWLIVVAVASQCMFVYDDIPLP